MSFMLEIIRSVYDNFVNGNKEEAQRSQMKIRRVIEQLRKYKSIPATKAILEHIGYKVGDATFPMKRYSNEEKECIVSDMRKAGLNL